MLCHRSHSKMAQLDYTKQNIAVIQTAATLTFFYIFFFLLLPPVELVTVLFSSLPHVTEPAAICSADLSQQGVAAARHGSDASKSTTCFVYFPEGRSSGAASLEAPTGAAAALQGLRKRRERKKEKKNPFSLGKNFIKCEQRGRTLHKPLM